MKQKEAQEWCNLAKDFQEASAHYGGQAIRLAYRNACSYYGEGFMLLYVKESESEPGKEVDDESVAREGPAAEATFNNLVTRGLRLARRTSGTSLWQDWAEFLVDNLRYHQENMQLYGQERSSYLRSQFFRLVDDSVMLCRQKELDAMSTDSVLPDKPLMARGLKATMKSAGVEVKEVAAKLNIDYTTVSKLRNCQIRITEDRITKLQEHYPQWTRQQILGPSSGTDFSPETTAASESEPATMPRSLVPAKT
jgi:hypothetical protein